jgi:hypothetical protein
MLRLSLSREAIMDKHVRLLALLMGFPALAPAQTSRPIPAQASMFEVLSDSQWVRVSSTGYPRHEARLLEHSAAEIVLDLERPLRIPVTSIDTLWERRTASRTGALVGGLLGAGIGVLVATQAVEEGETPPVDYVGLFAIGGSVGGGLLGALVGRAFPKWHRVYTR